MVVSDRHKEVMQAMLKHTPGPGHLGGHHWGQAWEEVGRSAQPAVGSESGWEGEQACTECLLPLLSPALELRREQEKQSMMQTLQ